MNYIRTSFVAVALLCAQVLWAQSSPIPMLENAANGIINTLQSNKANLKGNTKIIHQAVQHYLLPIVDVDGMARSVLGREAWLKASASEKKEFTFEFTELVIRTYANPLAEYSGETVKFLPLRGSLETKFVRVNSSILRPNGQNIPLTYSLVSKNGQWKVYDLSVEGVSLLQSFRSQFGQALQTESISQLVTQMRNKQAV